MDHLVHIGTREGPGSSCGHVRRVAPASDGVRCVPGMRVHDSFVGDDLACRVTCGYESCCLSDGCSQLRWLPAVRLLREMPLRSCRRALASGWLAVGPERVADFCDEALG